MVRTTEKDPARITNMLAAFAAALALYRGDYGEPSTATTSHVTVQLLDHAWYVKDDCGNNETRWRTIANVVQLLQESPDMVCFSNPEVR